MSADALEAFPLPVFTMPSGVPFLQTLAQQLTDQYGDRLSEALILLPTRRAVRGLGDAFVELAQDRGRGASLLPAMRPLADIDPDEPPFEIGDIVGRVPPAIPAMQRRFEMAKIVGQYHSNISDLPITPTGTLAIADQLLAILDDAAMEEVDLTSAKPLADIAQMAADHYQNAAKLYAIIAKHWPAYLAEQNLSEPMGRRVALLNALTDLWTDRPPNYPVIIAGSTGTLGATARLMACVARMKDCQIILPGLDVNLRESAWQEITAEHPQNALKRLLGIIGIDRSQVRDFANYPDSTGRIDRVRVISEALVPVAETSDWPGRIARLRDDTPGHDPFSRAFDGLSLIQAATDDEEALVIALIMRSTLEDGADKTAALVTPDPALARRVKAKLRRWNVEVDYSQGEPLEETQTGAYLSALMRLVVDRNNPVHLAAVAKHPLTQFGLAAGVLRNAWARIERVAMRGVRRSIPQIAATRHDTDHRGRPLFNAADQAAIDVLLVFHKALSDLCDITDDRWAWGLSAMAEALCATEDQPGKAVLWRGEAGEKAAMLLTNLIEHGSRLPSMTAQDFADVLSNLMRGQVVRPRYGMHPQLQILGPLEARMLSADVVILGGLNEGIWPAAPSVEPFLSRRMRREIGLSLPERRYGLSAHDFAELAANPQVIMTRSERSDSGPMVASRWLWRLQTLARGAYLDAPETLAAIFEPPQDYCGWARALDHVEPGSVNPVSRPTPNPPIEARWPRGRTIAVTRLTTLIRDPYAHYASTILGLRPLDPLDETLAARAMGTAVHDVLEDFARRHGDNLPDDAAAQLTDAFADTLAALNIPPALVSAERPRLARVARKYTDWFTQTRNAGWKTAGLEIEGQMDIVVAGGQFTATAKSDRLDMRDGAYKVVDYKTGLPSSRSEVQAGFDPQLPLTAAIIDHDGFKDIIGTASHLIYLSLRGHKDEDPVCSLTHGGRNPVSAAEYGEEAMENLRKIIDAFDAPEAVYHSQPRAKFSLQNKYGDYDHLARRAEWAKAGDDDNGGGGDT